MKGTGRTVLGRLRLFLAAGLIAILQTACLNAYLSLDEGYVEGQTAREQIMYAIAASNPGIFNSLAYFALFGLGIDETALYHRPDVDDCSVLMMVTMAANPCAASPSATNSCSSKGNQNFALILATGAICNLRPVAASERATYPLLSQ